MLKDEMFWLKLGIVVVFIIQVALLSYGVSQILSGDPQRIPYGIFNVILNLVFGVINIRNIAS